MFNDIKRKVVSSQITQAQHEQYASAGLDAELSRWIRKRQRFLCLRARMAAMVMRRAFEVPARQSMAPRSSRGQLVKNSVMMLLTSGRSCSQLLPRAHQKCCAWHYDAIPILVFGDRYIVWAEIDLGDSRDLRQMHKKVFPRAN